MKADLKTAQLLGKEEFLSTLRKIDEMRLVDIEKSKVESAKKRSWHTQGPTITKRIDNLLGGGSPAVPRSIHYLVESVGPFLPKPVIAVN